MNWNEAHERLATATRGHSQSHTRFVLLRGSPELYAISCAEGERVFSIYSTSTDDSCSDRVYELHISPEVARAFAAFVTELDPGPEL